MFNRVRATKSFHRLSAIDHATIRADIFLITLWACYESNLTRDYAPSKLYMS